MPTVRILDSLEALAPADWNRLAGDSPFLQHAFLHALHETGCACPTTRLVAPIRHAVGTTAS